MKGRNNLDRLAIIANQKTEERNYWLDKLKSLVPGTAFPSQHKEGKTPAEITLSEITFQLDAHVVSRLLQLSSGSDARLHMLLVTAVTALLWRYSGETDIITGTPVFQAGKTLHSAGDMPNTLVPLRNAVSGDTLFKQLLRQVKETVLEAAKHQGYPIEILVRDLNLVENDIFLFDVVTMLENFQRSQDVDFYPVHMVFSFQLTGEEIAGKLRYDSFRYPRPFVSRLAGHLNRLLAYTLFHQEEPLSSLDILTAAEKDELLVTLNGKESDYPKDKTIAQLFEDQAAKHPEDIAISGTPEYSYRQLNSQANQLAHFLTHKGFFKEGPRCGAILIERSPEMVVAILGILKAGGAYLPIDPDYPEKRIDKILEESDVSLLLTDSDTIHPFSFALLQGKRMSQEEVQEKLFMTQPRPQIKNFDSLPHPDRTLVDYNKYHQYIGIAPVKRTISLQTSRGCPYDCLYCHKIWPKKHLIRSAENIYEEILRAYRAGIRDFVFIDDIFNLHKKNSGRLLETIIKDNLNIRLYFPNGLRADVLTREFIDLMVKAGTVNIDVALESAVPRIQEMMKKRLDLDRFRENIAYIAETYPHVILEMEMMHGFPTETEEEALMTFEFLKSIKWIHFPNLNILKIFPNTEMYRLAVEHGVSKRAIENSTNFAYHELPETLPFPKSFTRQLQARLLEEYFLAPERLMHVLPQQMRVMSQEELIKKYDTYLPMEIRKFTDILDAAGISLEEFKLETGTSLKDWRTDHQLKPLNFNDAIRNSFPVHTPGTDAFRILWLDLSHFFTTQTGSKLYDVTEEPLGLMYLQTWLNQQLGPAVSGCVAKSMLDFNSYGELKQLIEEFQPHLIGIRTLSYYREFFHRTVAVIKTWGITAPIISGGPYATSDYPIMLKDPNVELAVLGEGEHTVLHLVETMIANGNCLPVDAELQKIPGIVFMPAVEKSLIRTGSRDILLLDTLQEQLAAEPQSDPGFPVSSGDLLYMISTSGSTGTPKSVMMPQRPLVNLIRFQQTSTAIDFSRVLQFASIAFDVSFQEIFSTLLSGGTIHIPVAEIRSNMSLLLAYIREKRIRTLFLPPAFLKFIFDEPEYRVLFPDSVVDIVTAGEQLVVTDQMRDHFKRHGIRLHNHYGPAETHVVSVFTMLPDDLFPTLPPIGRPIDNVRIDILSPSYQLQPMGVAGELYISGAAVGNGYYNNPSQTSARFIDKSFAGGPGGQFYKSAPLAAGGMYKTGDLALWLADGNIQFLGRIDQQVQVRGFRIELEEIRLKLLEVESVKDAVVIDGRSGEGDVYLCAYIIYNHGFVHTDTAELRESLMQELPDYMVPSYFISLSEIPLNSSGKVDHKALTGPELLSRGASGLPESETEKKLAKIWAQILDVPVGIDNNFFEMGGHSLKGTILISRIHREFHVKLLLVDIFKYPTIRSLARYLTDCGVDGESGSFQSIQPAPQRDYYPLSQAQKRIYIQQRMEPGATTYNLPVIVSVAGTLDTEKLKRVFNALVDRHESMRTAFVSVQKKTVQQIHKRVELEIRHFDLTAEPLGLVKGFIRPFDLTVAPLMRVGLIPLEDGTHILMVDIHHIISDAVTLEIIISEFIDLYEERSLEPLGLQYKDYSWWQNRLIESGGVDRQQQFWLERFEGELPCLNLPADFPRPEVRGSEGDSATFLISSELGTEVALKLRESGTTLYQYFLAVYFVLLHKYGGDTDIIVGSPVSGRLHDDLHHMVGVFVNMVMVRTRPMAGKSFVEFLEEVKNAALAAHEHQEYPFDLLVEKLDLKSTHGRSRINNQPGHRAFDVGFLFNALETKKIVNSQLEITPIKNIDPESEQSLNPVSRFDMLLAVQETGDGIALGIEFSTQLFKRQSILALLEHFEAILKQVTSAPGTLLEEIELKLDVKTIQSEQPEITFGF